MTLIGINQSLSICAIFLVEEVSMKWMDRPSVPEMDRGGVYEMDRQPKCQTNGNATKMDKI